jgi:hypothetical protein
MALEYDGEAPGQISCRSTRPRAGRSIPGRGRRLRRPPVFYLARAIQAETTCGESPFTQTIRIALAAFCQCYNSGGNHRLHGLIRAPEAVNVFYGSVVSVRHHRNVRLFKYGIADKWNYRRHSFPPIWLPPIWLRPDSVPLASRIPPIAMRVCSKLTTFGGRLVSACAVKSGHHKARAPTAYPRRAVISLACRSTAAGS